MKTIDYNIDDLIFSEYKNTAKKYKDMNYYITNGGIVISTNYNRIKELALQVDKDGYLYVKLSNRGKVKHSRVHRLVVETFFINPDMQLQVNHKDGNKQNNNIKNLELVTDIENKKHAIKMGLSPRGERARHSKLKEFQVIEIRKKHANGGYTTCRLGEEYKVHPSMIGYIINRKNWKHL